MHPAGAADHAHPGGAGGVQRRPGDDGPGAILDGLAAGILGVAVPSFIVSLLRGSGHVNAGQSVVMLMQGAGAAMSPALTGSIAGHYSYATAFGVLSVIAIVALMVWWRSAPLLTVSASPPVGESGQ